MPTHTADLAGRPQHLPRWRKEDPRIRPHLTTEDLHLYLTSAGPPSPQVLLQHRWRILKTPQLYRPCHRRPSKSRTSVTGLMSPYFHASAQFSALIERNEHHPHRANAPRPIHQATRLPEQHRKLHLALARSLLVKVKRLPSERAPPPIPPLRPGQAVARKRCRSCHS